MQIRPTMRLLHVADIHLGAAYAGFGRLAAERAKEVEQAFARLPDLAAEHRVDAVLMAGDLFDGPHPAPPTLALVREVLRRFVDLCTPVFIIPGNHDAISLKLNPYRELARAARVVVQNGESSGARRWPLRDEQGRQLAAKHSVYLLARSWLGEPVTVETGDGPLHVYGAAYDPADDPDPVASFRRHDAEGIHVVLLHAYVTGVGRAQASRDSLTLGLDDLDRLDVDYVALGDQHRPMPPEGFGGRPACYPGSFAATDLREVGPRGYVVVDLTQGAPPEVRHHESSVRPAVDLEFDVSRCGHDLDVAHAVARLLTADAIPVVRLVGEPAFPLDPDRVATELVDRFGHAAVTDSTRFYAARRLAELADGDTVVGHVVRLGQERIGAAGSDREREVAEQALRVVLRALEVA